MKYFAIFLAVALAIQQGVCQEANSPQGESEDRFAHARRDAEQIKVRLLSDKTKEVELHPGPLFTSEEVIRPWDKGTSWVWGGKGRPVAFLSMTTFLNTLYYEFISLTTQRIEVEGHGGQWIPEPGWTPLAIEDAPEPADDLRRRALQLRSLARRFTVHTIDQYENGARHDLELLPHPIYRYAEASDESLDGGIFAFVRDSNVEAILVIDAAIEDGKARWVFDCERSTIHEVVVELDERPVWTAAAMMDIEGTPESTYHVFKRPVLAEESLPPNKGSLAE